MLADGFIDLEKLQSGSFGQHATTAEDYKDACTLPIQQGGMAANEGGDAIQGL